MYYEKGIDDVKVKLFCDNCFRIYEKRIGDLTDEKLITSSHYLDCTYTCECGNKAYSIDNRMIDFVVRLNRINFYTKYCCEGHWDADTSSYSCPYILFTYNDENDCSHTISLKDHEYLYDFLKKNLNPILRVSLFNDKAIIISSERIIPNMNEFELFKEECLTEFNRIIDLLEIDRLKL